MPEMNEGPLTDEYLDGIFGDLETGWRPVIEQAKEANFLREGIEAMKEGVEIRIGDLEKKIAELEQRSDLQREQIEAMEKLLDDATYYEPAVQQALWAEIRTLREKLAA